MNIVRVIKYVGEKKDFLQFAQDMILAFDKKQKQGKMVDVSMFVVGTVNGEEKLQIWLAKILPKETLVRTGVRIGIFKPEVLLEPITRDQWITLKKAAFEEIEAHPDIRIGQALFNVLYEYFPELANTVRATDADPFEAKEYTDPRVTKFYDKIVKQES